MKIGNLNTETLRGFVFDTYNFIFCIVKLLLIITALSAIEAYDPIRPESIGILTLLNSTVFLSIVLSVLYFVTKYSHKEKISETITTIVSLSLVVELVMDCNTVYRMVRTLNKITTLD